MPEDLRPARSCCLLLQTHRQHRDEQARLLEENAALKARIAAEAARVAMGALPGAGVGRPGPKTFAAVGEAGAGVGGVLDAWLHKLERWVQLFVCFTHRHSLCFACCACLRIKTTYMFTHSLYGSCKSCLL